MKWQRRSFKDVVLHKVGQVREDTSKRMNEKKQEYEEENRKYEKTRVVYGDIHYEVIAKLESIVGETLYYIQLIFN